MFQFSRDFPIFPGYSRDFPKAPWLVRMARSILARLSRLPWRSRRRDTEARCGDWQHVTVLTEILDTSSVWALLCTSIFMISTNFEINGSRMCWTSVFTITTLSSPFGWRSLSKLWQAKSREQDAKQKQMEADVARWWPSPKENPWHVSEKNQQNM